MIKVLLVDDEDIEREAMAEIIPWEKLDKVDVLKAYL